MITQNLFVSQRICNLCSICKILSEIFLHGKGVNNIRCSFCHLIQTFAVDVVYCVARLMIAWIERSIAHTTKDCSLFHILFHFCSTEQTTSRNIVIKEWSIIRSSSERSQFPSKMEFVEKLLIGTHNRDRGGSNTLLSLSAIVDGTGKIGRTEHIIIDVQCNIFELLTIGIGEIGDIVGRSFPC